MTEPKKLPPLFVLDAPNGKALIASNPALTESDALEAIRRCEMHDRLVEAERAGFALSTWAASINWGAKDTNTEGWLSGLRDRIEAVQEIHSAILKENQ